MRIIRSLFALTLAASVATVAVAADKDKAASKRPEKAASATGEKGRDWAQIDTNKDGFVSPDEMDAFLKANPGPQR